MFIQSTNQSKLGLRVHGTPAKTREKEPSQPTDSFTPSQDYSGVKNVLGFAALGAVPALAGYMQSSVGVFDSVEFRGST